MTPRFRLTLDEVAMLANVTKELHLKGIIRPEPLKSFRARLDSVLAETCDANPVSGRVFRFRLTRPAALAVAILPPLYASESHDAKPLAAVVRRIVPTESAHLTDLFRDLDVLTEKGMTHGGVAVRSSIFSTVAASASHSVGSVDAESHLRN